MEVNDLVGQVFRLVEVLGDSVWFRGAGDMGGAVLYHEQNCCENVYLAEVSGDLTALEGTPIRSAAQATEPYPEADVSGTVTTFTFGSDKGRVTLKWIGTSNGYYTEGVDIREITPDIELHRTV
jgi:hypothetical protein